MSAGLKVILGVLITVTLVAIAGVAAVYFGLVSNPIATTSDSRILVIASAPDEEGTDVAVAAFAVEPETGNVALLSTLESATIPGTSAATPRDALPFGGGDAVSRALASQTGGITLDWVIAPAPVWASFVDDSGGVHVDMPSAMNAYSQGKLVAVGSGPQRLSGEQAIVVAASTSYLGDLDVQREVLRQISAGVSAAMGSSDTRLRDAVASGAAASSLDPDRIPSFQPER